MGGHIADFELWYRESDTKDLDYNKCYQKKVL